jgi:putative hydrolase of the HAD superfamily
MQKALIFDFGNVIITTTDYSYRHQWDDLLGYPHGTVESHVHNSDSWVQAQHGTISMSDYWADVQSRLGLSAEQVKQLAVDFYAGDTLDDELLNAIRAWREQGVIVGLLSNDSIELRDKLIHLGIEALFTPLVISGEIGAMKPNAPAYQAVCQQLPQIPVTNMIFIDDRADNIAGAEAIGMIGVQYHCQTSPTSQLIKRLGQLLNAPSPKLS